MKKVILESGLRDIKDLRKRYPKAKIYFHQDLDGVTTALAMKKYLEENGFDVVDSEIIPFCLAIARTHWKSLNAFVNCAFWR